MSKLTVFLSHSSRDKPFVRRLNKDIKSHGFNTWIDEDDIAFGSSISSEIQKGLEKSDVLFVMLSSYSISSKWVSAEWQAKFFREMTDRDVKVIPVLLEKCEPPSFLLDKKYIDFTNKGDYENSISKTLDYLAKLNLDKYGSRVSKLSENQGIFSHVVEILDDLKGESLSFPVHKRIPIVETLNKIPRSGKKIRLAHFKPALRARSIYDHTVSLAHLADCIMPELDHKLSSAELGDLSLCIAYHELNEVILGDIPSYTGLNRNRRNLIRVYAEERLRGVTPDEREEIANKLIWLFLSEKHRQALKQTLNVFSDRNGKVFRYFRALDKFDPIVAIWRYLYHFRGKIGENPKEFNKVMKDFFENPDVRNFMRANKIDNRLIELAIFLQDRRNAWEYYENADIEFSDRTLFNEIPWRVVKKMIEDIPLYATSD